MLDAYKPPRNRWQWLFNMLVLKSWIEGGANDVEWKR